MKKMCILPNLRQSDLEELRKNSKKITKAETEYRKWVKQLKLGNNINLIPPKDFEENTFSMTLRFNNRQDLSDLNKKIEKIIQHPALGKILD